MYTMPTVTTGVLDEMPDSMTLDTMQQPILSPSPSPTRDRPTHPASVITALREAVSAAFPQGPSDQKTSPRSRNSASSRLHPPHSHLSDTVSKSGLQQAVSSIPTVPMQSTYVSSEPSSHRPLQPDLRELSLRHARPHVRPPLTSPTNLVHVILHPAHHHPEAPGTPWVGSPLEATLGHNFEEEAGPATGGLNPLLPSMSAVADSTPTTASTDTGHPLQIPPGSLPLPLIAEQAPASKATTDVIDDNQYRQTQIDGTTPAATFKRPNSPWPSADELAPEVFHDYLASMEVPKPKPRPRRKHLDRKMELARMKKQLEDILAHRAHLLRIEEASSAPPDMQGATDRILRVHGLSASSWHDSASADATGHLPSASESGQRPASAQSRLPEEHQDNLTTGGAVSRATTTIEDEILTLNDEIERLMVSISELDKIRDPQIEISFTGPKTKNLQRARQDDELWTELTGRSPGIVSNLYIQILL